MNQKPIHILLFEDDDESLQYLKDHLEEENGWSVEMTAHESILERLKIEVFDLIVVDLMIHPNIDKSSDESISNVHYEGINYKSTGLEFIRRLRVGEYSTPYGTSKDVPIVGISAFSDSIPEFEEDDPVSFITFLEKPFLLHEIVAKLKDLIKKD